MSPIGTDLAFSRFLSGENGVQFWESVTSLPLALILWEVTHYCAFPWRAYRTYFLPVVLRTPLDTTRILCLNSSESVALWKYVVISPRLWSLFIFFNSASSLDKTWHQVGINSASNWDTTWHQVRTWLGISLLYYLSCPFQGYFDLFLSDERIHTEWYSLDCLPSWGCPVKGSTLCLSLLLCLILPLNPLLFIFICLRFSRAT